MSFSKILLLIGWVSLVAFSNSGYAEEFLGEVYDQDVPAKKDAHKKKSDTTDSGESPWTFGIGLGGGAQGFSGNFQAHYHVNRVIVPEMDLSYQSFRSNGLSRKETAIGTPLLLFGANPTPFWPFVGAGPGYVAWQQGDELGTYDKAGSLTGFYLYGILLKFSERFGLVLESRTTHYLGSTPAKKITDRGLPTEEISYEENDASDFSFSFQLNF